MDCSECLMPSRISNECEGESSGMDEDEQLLFGESAEVFTMQISPSTTGPARNVTEPF